LKTVRFRDFWCVSAKGAMSNGASSYHKNVELPIQALRAASELGEYTVTDRGTWWAVEGEVRERMVVFVSRLFLVF
jgi:ABC-type tungstate transport system permease subunit